MLFLVMCGKYNKFYEICCKIGNLFLMNEDYLNKRGLSMQIILLFDIFIRFTSGILVPAEPSECVRTLREGKLSNIRLLGHCYLQQH